MFSTLSEPMAVLSARGDRVPIRDALARLGDDRMPLREVPGNLPAVRPQSQASSRQVNDRAEDWAVKPFGGFDFREDSKPAPARSSIDSARAQDVTEALRSSESECARLRAHCEELLKLNGTLRQQQLDITVGTFSGKFDSLLREFSQLRGFNQTLRNVVDTVSQSRKDLKELHQAVSPIAEMSTLMDVALDKVRTSLRDDVRQVVEEQMASMRDQLTRLHENSTRMVELTLANRKDFDDHRFGLSSGELDELLEITRESKELIRGNGSKLDATWELVQSNKKSIDRNAETILSNKRSIEENRGFIQSNKELIKEEQDKAQAEALTALEKVQALQDELRMQEHTLAEKARIEREIFESQRLQSEMEEEMKRLQDEMQEDEKEDNLTTKVEAMLDAVEKVLERIDKPDVHLGQQLRAVSEITRRGNLEINLNSGDVKLKRRIVFKKRNPGDSPTAEFENEQEAMDVLRDIAELWQMFSVPVVVEGHTKDIGAGTDQFWQDVANSRAALCAATLGMMGVDLGQIVAVGKPGKSGLNKATLVVHFDIFLDIK